MACGVWSSSPDPLHYPSRCVREGIYLGLIKNTALPQQPHQAMRGRFDDPLDVGIPQGGRRHKDRRSPCLATGIDPIQHQHVEMRIEIQRAAEALDKGHRSALDVGVALRSSLLAIPGLDGAADYVEVERFLRFVAL